MGGLFWVRRHYDRLELAKAPDLARICIGENGHAPERVLNLVKQSFHRAACLMRRRAPKHLASLLANKCLQILIDGARLVVCEGRVAVEGGDEKAGNGENSRDTIARLFAVDCKGCGAMILGLGQAQHPTLTKLAREIAGGKIVAAHACEEHGGGVIAMMGVCDGCYLAARRARAEEEKSSRQEKRQEER